MKELLPQLHALNHAVNHETWVHVINYIEYLISKSNQELCTVTKLEDVFRLQGRILTLGEILKLQDTTIEKIKAMEEDKNMQGNN